MYVLLTLAALAAIVILGALWHVRRSPERHRQDGGVERKP